MISKRNLNSLDLKLRVENEANKCKLYQDSETCHVNPKWTNLHKCNLFEYYSALPRLPTANVLVTCPIKHGENI